MLGRTKKCGSNLHIMVIFLSFTAAGSFKEVFQERECRTQAAFAWFKCLHRAVGSLLRRDECLEVSHYGNEALSPLTCFLLHLSISLFVFKFLNLKGKDGDLHSIFLAL